MKKAFPLIELLIVIAIIAIPNFLEAQIRSKVSRVHADRRSLGAAIEAGEMIYIPGGETILGTTAEEAQSLAKEYNVHPSLFANETPQRKATVKAFYIDRFPVTNAQYQEFIKATGHRAPSHWKENTFPTGQADWPATNVDWTDAKAYADWAGKRLPTEEEWERAARGNDGRLYPWGNEWNLEACRPDDGTSLGTPQPFPVGCFPKGASPFGVMDMVGNVAQWTATPTAPINPATPGKGWYVVKGAGAAHHLRFNFRCAARDLSASLNRVHSWLGFRCAEDAPETEPAPIPAASAAPPIATGPAPARTAEPGPAAKPDAAKYQKEPITIAARQGGHMASFLVPYFPNARFQLLVPEWLFVNGRRIAWDAPHTPTQWEMNPEKTRASYSSVFEDKVKMTVTLKSSFDDVELTIALRNLGDKPLTGVKDTVCMNNHGAPFFEDPERDRTVGFTDDGPVRLLEMRLASYPEPLHTAFPVAGPDEPAPKGGAKVRYPIAALLSRDRQWIIAHAFGASMNIGGNPHFSCLHADPRWPDVPPGEERAVTGKLYFLKGGPEELLARWKADFAGGNAQGR
ncbi:MAG: SUMF1/EgtB/PvdO family nonheme iron enzyme [Candidatus Sumerlaeota bacterium]|nr:SUMF1/EgtB/PvdO family nonheme iron enzyme [Candidatus Sumerlaeota bacterium]